MAFVSFYFFSLILAGSTSPKKEIFKMHSLNDIDFKSLKLNKPLSYCYIIYYNSLVHDHYETINKNSILIKK